MTAAAPIAARIYRLALFVMIFIMLAELVALIHDRRWMPAFLVTALMMVVSIPALFRGSFTAAIPIEIQLFAVLFIFASLFLGEFLDFYDRFWWWDLALHAVSGILLGLLGFLIVYLLNEARKVDLALAPSFVALFAFLFAVGIGALWEIFEFAMDQLAGTSMQKPMMGDPSGKTDTMWDLILDTLGAAIVSIAGWRYMLRARNQRTDHWLRRFVDSHPEFFRKLHD